MAHLSLSLLGTFQVTLDGQPVTGFKSNKVRALLAYLAVEADKPHRRETLAGLLWPDWPDRDALSNLRYALSDLRGAIGDRTAEPPFLLISRDSIQFNLVSDYRLDSAEFAKGAEVDRNHPAFYPQLEEIIDLYQSSFLEGFSLEDSSAFEEWTLLTRERLARQATSVLHALAESCEQRGEYKKAQSFAWRQLELEPWDETAHQQLMRALALGGQRSAALAQYETCKGLLANELGVEPSSETTMLYERIRDGKLRADHVSQSIKDESILKPPAFLEEKTSSVETPVFVARTRELSKLDEHLSAAISGKGGVIFIAGEAGSGKTALLQESTRRAQEAYPDLLVAMGNCNAYTGIGDPYLPFREILEFLTGDIESRWAAGAITREHALRLWENVPIAAQALVEVGPDLIDTFIQRAALTGRARSSVSEKQGWLNRLDAFLDRKPVTALSIGALQQVNLYEQYVRVLHFLEKKNPMLLVIDDLQWVDTGSINLLFHLGRRLSGSRILILGAYRSEEVALGREGGRHPLEPLVNEFRRSFGEVLLNLGQGLGQDESREFVNEVLDKEPNRLDESFREMLHRQTQGHPLFTIELLRGLQERGDILKDSEGCWVVGPSLDWDTLPVRVEAAIQERISRLPEATQRTLEVASVEGEFFTAEVVSRVREISEVEILECLSGELNRKHRLIRAQSVQRVKNRLVSRYQFRHILSQKYLYANMDKVVRVHLHEQIGSALEELYDGESDVATVVAVQLALHFQEARIVDKAIKYLYLAGNNAINMSAYQEGVIHLTRGIELLENFPPSESRDEKELEFRIALAIGWQGSAGGQLPKVRNAYLRARELCQKLNKQAELAQVIGGLTIFYYVHAEHHKAMELAFEALDLAQSIDDKYLVLLCRWYLGFINFCLGEFPKSLEYLKQVAEFYDHRQHHQILVQMRGSDPGLGAMAYEACCLWCLGYPDQAQEKKQEVLALSHEFSHPFTHADVLCFAGCLLSSMRQDANNLDLETKELIQLSRGASLAGWMATGERYLGETLVLQGKITEGIVQLNKGFETLREEGIGLYLSGTFATLAEGQLRADLIEDARATIDEAFKFVEETDERYWESELFRLKGELLIMDGEISGAEACMNRAIEIAQKQSAKSLELRAAMSLSRLWQQRGKKTQAKKMLVEVYNWFTEGFDTPDFIEAKELLDKLK